MLCMVSYLSCWELATAFSISYIGVLRRTKYQTQTWCPVTLMKIACLVHEPKKIRTSRFALALCSLL